MNRIGSLMTIVSLGLTLFGCDSINDPGLSKKAPVQSNKPTVSFSISDGATGGNDIFYFLPPLVPEPNPIGVFDSTLTPVVDICELETVEVGCAAVQPAGLPIQFTTETGPGSETVRVVPEEEHYIVNWHTDQFSLSSAKLYRISVIVDGTPLGHADVDVVNNGKDLKNVDTEEYIGLVNGRTLPIKFRIEEGAGSRPCCLIDATALSASTFVIPNVGTFSTDVPIQIDLAAGVYSFLVLDDGETSFTVAGDGTIEYDAALDPIQSGRGTTTLTITGYPITIDAIALSDPSFVLVGIETLMADPPVVARLLPGFQRVQAGDGGETSFTVAGDGTIEYDAALDPIQSGRGTTTLTITGYPITIDAIALSDPSFVLVGIETLMADPPVVARLLPGFQRVQAGDGGETSFTIASDGTIEYDAALDPIQSGRGTTTLTITGYPITIDATALGTPTFVLVGIETYSTAIPVTVNLLPGFQRIDVTYEFDVTDAGTVDYDPSFDAVLSGRGTNVLTITP